jgi:bifunctional DNase/RNase
MGSQLLGKGGNMIQVFPYHIRRSEDGYSGELLLRLGQGKTAVIIHLSLEQARRMAVEMRGLATDHYPNYHLGLSIARALEARINMVILKMLSRDQVIGSLQLKTGTGSVDVDADVATALGMAIHLGVPIFMEGDQVLSQDKQAAVPWSADPPAGSQIPDAFLDVIENLDLS